MVRNTESADQLYASLANEEYRFRPTWKLTTLEEWRAYQKAEAVMWEFVQLLMYFDVRIRMPSLGCPQATLPNPAYFFLRDTVMNILLDKCELVLMDGEWIRTSPGGEHGRALGPRPRKKKSFWNLFRKKR